jgi:hypothetical protein
MDGRVVRGADLACRARIIVPSPRRFLSYFFEHGRGLSRICLKTLAPSSEPGDLAWTLLGQRGYEIVNRVHA